MVKQSWRQNSLPYVFSKLNFGAKHDNPLFATFDNVLGAVHKVRQEKAMTDMYNKSDDKWEGCVNYGNTGCGFFKEEIQN